MSQFKFDDVEKFEERLAKFKKEDLYLTVRKEDLSVKEIEGGPIFASVNEKSYDSDEEHIRKASEEGCLALAYSDGSRLHAVPFDRIGQTAFLQRIGLNCPMFNAAEGTSRYDAMSEEDKVSTINSVLPLWKDKVILLVRDGMVRYTGSEASSFEDMQQADLFDFLTDSLARNYPDAEFVCGSGDNSETEALFDLWDEALSRNLTAVLGEATHAQLLFATSDVGLRAASLFPIASTRTMKVPIGPAIEVLHKKPNNASNIGEMVPKLSAAFEDNTKRLRELSKMEIQYPRGCFNAIAKMLVAKTPLTKKVALTVGDDLEIRYPEGCNGLDIYRALLTAIKAESESRPLHQSDILVMNEALASMITLDFRELDHIVEL